MKSLLILGAGGFGQMVKETAIQLGYEEIVFLDDAAFGKDVVGKCCDYTARYGEYKMAVAAFGNNHTRLFWTHNCRRMHDRWHLISCLQQFVCPE